MYTHVMVPLDGSPLAECVLPHVDRILTAAGAQKVTLVRVEEPFEFARGVHTMVESGRKPIEESAMAKARDYLKDVAGRLSRPGADIRVDVLMGNVAVELTRFAEKKNVDLIIMSTHGRSGVTRWALGSVADKLLSTSSVPILLVRPAACFVPLPPPQQT